GADRAQGRGEPSLEQRRAQLDAVGARAFGGDGARDAVNADLVGEAHERPFPVMRISPTGRPPPRTGTAPSDAAGAVSAPSASSACNAIAVVARGLPS